jgi:hypothetical protein
LIGSASQITHQQFFALSLAVARVFRRWLSGLAASYELDYYFPAATEPCHDRKSAEAA